MESEQYLGWVALALTPGLGPRLAGKLLAEFGTPAGVFNASLTALEAQRLPAAVAQAIHSRQPMSAAAKELAQAQASGYKLLTWDEAEYPARLREIYDPHPCFMSAANFSFWAGRLSRLSARGVPRLTGTKWLKSWGAIWQTAGW